MENIGAPPAVSTSNSFFAPLLVSMIGIFCTGLVLVIYHFVLTKFCLRRPPQTINNSPIPETELAKGVDQKILEKIPIMAYSVHKLGLFRVDQNECAVCLGELEDDEMVRLLPNCRHAFHVTCIDEWLVAHTNCPICRSPVTETTTHVMYLLHSLPFFSPSVLNEESGVCRGDCSSTSTSSSSGIKLPQESHGMLRHCLSLVVPKERRLSSQKRLIPGLRRSLSMDHSFIVINREKEYEGDTLLRSKSMKNNDGVSSKLLRSLSRLRRGKGSQIIPY